MALRCAIRMGIKGNFRLEILVVDDQAANRGVLSYLLEEDGHEV